MKNIIVGTAGHIDHGKTSLVKALTGIDADRLEEEKRRGITIDLGFAHLQLTSEIRLGFVDVPGHERFVKNMLAGAAGIDLVLFVIAADESIKPQTREHFDICRLLGVRAGVVALTKCDAVDQDLLDLVKLEAEEFFANSFLEGAPIVPVSSLTGSGLAELREALREQAASTPQKDAAGPARLPVDRSFSMRGFGTVVTGTLASGVIERDQILELLPAGRDVRVRGIQVHGEKTDRALAGSRTALNLADIEAKELQRGMVIAQKGEFQATREIDCRIELLPSAARLKNRAPVHFHAGTAEGEGIVRLLNETLVLEPGASAFARIRLREPMVLAPGDRYILRRFSPVTTIGGGSVIDAAPPKSRRGAAINKRLNVLETGTVAEKIGLLVEESIAGLPVTALAARLSIREQDVMSAAMNGSLWAVPGHGWIARREWAAKAREALISEVRDHHARAPLETGMPRHDLKTKILPAAPAFLFEAILAECGELAAEGDRIRHRQHRVVLREDELQARTKMEAAFLQGGLSAPATAEILKTTGLDLARGQSVLQVLLREKVLVRVSNDLILHQSAIGHLRALLQTKKTEAFSVATFKEWTGISRKFAVPLLEFCDREKLTVRRGDLRTIV